MPSLASILEFLEVQGALAMGDPPGVWPVLSEDDNVEVHELDWSRLFPTRVVDRGSEDWDLYGDDSWAVPSDVFDRIAGETSATIGGAGQAHPGWDRCAWYQPIHFHGPAWGIFLYDQLGGGFARYSVDASWVVPHFEKMLYDNALLLRAYAHWARRTGDPLARRVAGQTAEFLINDLSDGEMFTSSLDADAAGSEGSTYVWTPAQLREVLGEDDGLWAARVFEVTERGAIETGGGNLHLWRSGDGDLRGDRIEDKSGTHQNGASQLGQIGLQHERESPRGGLIIPSGK